MKIIVYINSLYASGGIERIVYNLINEWKTFCEIEVIVKDSGDCFYGKLDGVTVTTIDEPRNIDMSNRWKRIITTFFNSTLSSYKLKKILATRDYQYVYVTTPLNTAELLLAGVSSDKIVVSEHGSAFGVNAIYKIIKEIVYPKVRCIAVPNKMDNDFYLKKNFRSIYVPHILKNKNKTKNSLDRHIVLNVGRLTDDKRQDILISCWANIEDRGDWELWIVGNGENREKINLMINNLGLDDVRLIPETKNIELIYSKASIFAFTSRFEGFGLVLCEAMSFGIPCISFDCPSGPRDIIQHGINGYLIENCDCKKYTEYLSKMIHMDKCDMNRMGQYAYESIQTWDNNNIIDLWKRIFEDKYE